MMGPVESQPEIGSPLSTTTTIHYRQQKNQKTSTYESSQPMDHLSHSLSGQSQATQQQPQLHRRSRASALRIEGRLSRRIFRRRSQYRASSDLRGYLCALASRPCRDPGKCGNVRLFHGSRSARNFAAPQEISTHRSVAARAPREFPAPANFRSQTGPAVSRPLFVIPRPALCLTIWEMPTFTRRHPERSRFSGVAKDLPLNRLRASAKLHRHRTAPNLDDVSGSAAAPSKDGASAPRKPSRKNLGSSP